MMSMTRRVAAINDCESAFDVDDGGMLLGDQEGEGPRARSVAPRR